MQNFQTWGVILLFALQMEIKDKTSSEEFIGNKQKLPHIKCAIQTKMFLINYIIINY